MRSSQTDVTSSRSKRQLPAGEVPDTSGLAAQAIGGEFALPVFVFQGAEDFTTPASLARTYVRSLRAPRKTFVAIDGGGHFALFMKSRGLSERVGQASAAVNESPASSALPIAARGASP